MALARLVLILVFHSNTFQKFCSKNHKGCTISKACLRVGMFEGDRKVGNRKEALRRQRLRLLYSLGDFQLALSAAAFVFLRD